MTLCTSLIYATGILIISSVAMGQGCQEQVSDNETLLICEGLMDTDLPFLDAQGLYDVIQISNSPNLLQIGNNAFGSASARTYIVADNTQLEMLDIGFMAGSNVGFTEEIIIRSNPALRSIDWAALSDFFALETFEISSCGLDNLQSDTPWPASLENINLSNNTAIIEIPQYVFRNAVGLKVLNMSRMSGQINLRTEAFNIQSQFKPTLILNAVEGPYEGAIEEDAFGNVLGGELWGRMELSLWDFPEETFRLMLKAHFDLFSEELLIPDPDPIMVKDCSNCSIAWLYKDAMRFGMDKYLSLVGDQNVICPGVGPVLQTDDLNFIQEMEDCPLTEMPWPDGNPCKDHDNGSQVDTVVDPADCKCFYKCNGQEVAGHDCCQPGLVYNPSTGICDWPANVPTCDGK